MEVSELSEKIMAQADEKGFGTKPEDIIVAEKIALIHSEVSEAYEAYRHNNLEGKDGFKEELADIIIRVMHLAGIFEIDLEEEIAKKMEYNETRVWNFAVMNEQNLSK